MDTAEFINIYNEKALQEDKYNLLETDQEFAELFYNFAFDEVRNQNDIQEKISIDYISSCCLPWYWKSKTFFKSSKQNFRRDRN